MKYASDWWGVQIVAETEEEEELLSKLFKSLPEEAFRSYEDTAGADLMVFDEAKDNLFKDKCYTCPNRDCPELDGGSCPPGYREVKGRVILEISR